MVIDMAYTYQMALGKGHCEFFAARHANGYFDRVWSVHPLADVAGKPSRRLEFIRFSPRHLLVEGVSRGCRLPSFLAPINFLIAQAAMLRVLLRLVRRHRLDVIITGDPFYGGLLGTMLKRLSGLPLVIGVWANYDLAFRTAGTLAMPRLLPSYRLQNLVSEFVLKRADLVIAGNRNNLNYAIAHGAPTHRAEILAVPRNIHPSHFLPPQARRGDRTLFQSLGIPTDRRYLLTVGRLIPPKYPADAVKAMIRVAGADSRVVGIVAGEGSLRATLEGMVSAAGLRDRFFFLGNVAQETLSRIIPHCITISPITGMALVECGLGGSPVVAYDVDWQAEFVKDGVNGYVVPFLDGRAMAERALRLLGDDELRERMTKAARNLALEFADLERLHAKEREVYDRLLARGNN
jgi:glycosyltransferase involved in cell wall biosynthesis